MLNLLVSITLGWGLGKKCLPIDSGIMGAYADIYRRLLDQKDPGAYFIKIWAQGISVLLYYNRYNDSMVATSNGDIRKFSLIKPQHYCLNILFIYEFHNKTSFLGHFEVVDL